MMMMLASNQRPTLPSPLGCHTLPLERGWSYVAVPGDGDCWFWSVVLAFNFPGQPGPCVRPDDPAFPSFVESDRMSVPLTVSDLRRVMAVRLIGNQHLVRRLLETTIQPEGWEPPVHNKLFQLKEQLMPYMERASAQPTAEHAAALQQCMLHSICPKLHEIAITSALWSDWFTIKAMGWQRYDPTPGDPVFAMLTDTTSAHPFLYDPQDTSQQYFICFVVVEHDSKTGRFALSFHDRYMLQYQMTTMHRTVQGKSFHYHFFAVFTLLQNQHYTLLQYHYGQHPRRVFTHRESLELLTLIPFRSAQDRTNYDEFVQGEQQHPTIVQ